MNKILTVSLLLLSAAIALSSSEVAEETNYNGSASDMMENFAEHTAGLNNELLTEYLAKSEHVTKTFVDDIETVITSAVNQLALPIENFQKRIASSQCQPLITLQELHQQIDSDFSKCTQGMKQLVNTFEQDAHQFKLAFDKNIREIVDLPKKCETGENAANFGSKVKCFIGNIAGFNQQIAAILHNASETLALTRQLGEKALQEGRICAKNVIVTTSDSLDKLVANCQLVEQ